MIPLTIQPSRIKAIGALASKIRGETEAVLLDWYRDAGQPSLLLQLRYFRPLVREYSAYIISRIVYTAIVYCIDHTIHHISMISDPEVSDIIPVAVRVAKPPVAHGTRFWPMVSFHPYKTPNQLSKPPPKTPSLSPPS